jgi:hypothetical protein
MAKKNASKNRPLGTGTQASRQPLGTGTEASRLLTGAQNKTKNGDHLSGLWKRLGTEPETGSVDGTGTQTLKLAMLPGKYEPIKPGEERMMKVSLSKVKVKGRTALKISLEG